MTRKMANLDELKNYSKEDLIEHIKKLNDHIYQLKNVIKKRDSNSEVDFSSKQKKFDFSKYGKRHVALKFFYLGWKYEGFVEQENTPNTVENFLFKALLKVHLIENRQTCNYHRCGRTDKGVSAYSQIISLDLRSKLSEDGLEEINYCKILNKVLPKKIRCISWSEVRPDFSARFDCKKRTYKYFFHTGNLDLEAMSIAGKFLEGTHDFRNFCKLDRTKVETNYLRSIQQVKISSFQSGQMSFLNINQIEIISTAFLWHQIRCIVSVLFCIGENKEKPELILELLDLNKYPKKPYYSLAYELPLVLFSCEYDTTEINWNYDSEGLKDAVESLKLHMVNSSIKNAITFSMFIDLTSHQIINNDPFTKELQTYYVKDLVHKNYKKFDTRPLLETELNDKNKEKLVERIKHKTLTKEVNQINNLNKKLKLDS